DWRLRSDIAGTRQDKQIHLPTPAAGTADERRRCKITGTDADWDNFSIQWDGVINIPNGGVDLATSSDDGSRVWIDHNGDGTATADEWGGNGWGEGQGTTQRDVQRDLRAGQASIRVQFEDGGGPNACSLLWRGVAGSREWKRVPPEAFLAVAQLTVTGSVTLAGPITGGGLLVCHDGVHLATKPKVRTLVINGRVAVDQDLDLRGIAVVFGHDATLVCAGHALILDRPRGTGTVDLNGGELSLPIGAHDVSLRGPGTLHAGAGITEVTAFDENIVVRGQQYTVRNNSHCRTAVHLQSPLTTVVPLNDDAATYDSIQVEVIVPTDAPTKLGIGVWRSDRSGRWYQRIHPTMLTVGRHEIRFQLDGLAALKPEGHRGLWTAAADGSKLGLLFFSDQSNAATLLVHTHAIASPATIPVRTSLVDLELDGFDGRVAHATTARRWELHARPVPYPADPFDPAVFRMNLIVTEPDGTQRTFAGFHDQNVQPNDEGNRVTYTAVGAPRFSIRFRARVPGIHRLRLVTSSRQGPDRVISLSDLHVRGLPGDGIVHVDGDDPRFFSVNGRFVWPLGHSLHSNYDTRSVQVLHSKLTVNRGQFTRQALLERLVAHGGTGCEIWLSAWNLGLEWIPTWPGYHGPGNYHDGHAWEIDRFLDAAERLGVRANVSIYNHGMARGGGGAEEEWRFHPFNVVNGGWLDQPSGLFTDDRAFAYQQRMFRYLAARYGDSPALLGWKLWAEVNLVQAPVPAVEDWHRRASEALHKVDPYQHPVTTHWCGDWHNANRTITSLPTVNYVTIDAYHGVTASVANVLNNSTHNPLAPKSGLADIGKPIVVTEFGGNWDACAEPRLIAEHAIGPWVGLVSGHAASPMLWWFEWIDQGERYGVYRALSRFIAGEDLRGKTAQCVAPTVTAGKTALWCRAWRNDQRWLGYIVDLAWSMAGGSAASWDGCTLMLEADVAPGTLLIEWWNADNGNIVTTAKLVHSGGKPAFAVPPFAGHLAFKVRPVTPTPTTDR
ncbi:MAG: hypothetical protein AAB263_03090, partial [Planctomycetota bacterium]